jgi:hypothetical protein
MILKYPQLAPSEFLSNRHILLYLSFISRCVICVDESVFQYPVTHLSQQTFLIVVPQLIPFVSDLHIDAFSISGCNI